MSAFDSSEWLCIFFNLNVFLVSATLFGLFWLFHVKFDSPKLFDAKLDFTQAISTNVGLLPTMTPPAR